MVVKKVKKEATIPVSAEVAEPSPAAEKEGKKARSYDLTKPELYLNRELTWLNFNRRVLHEAQDSRTPVLERVKFLAIVCSNLDEFFMKRIGGLKQQVGAGMMELTVDGRNPRDQIRECHEVIHDFERLKSEIFDQMVALLRENNIFLLDYEELSDEERHWVRDHFHENYFPLVTPQGIDPAHPFPFISNLALNLLVTLRPTNQIHQSLARVKVPLGPDVPRFVQIRDSFRFVRLEDIMSHNLDLLFPKLEIVSVDTFRVTRNAVAELDEDEADDLLAMIETELRYRKFASMVRLQVSPGMAVQQRGKLAADLGLDEAADVFEVNGMIGKVDLFEIAALDLPTLKYPPHHAIDHPRLMDKRSIFYNLRDDGPILVAHPYESFVSSVERFLMEASEDPKVRGIKMILYRTSKKSKVIQFLVNAARNGKQVTVVVELKARFDEAANIRWANHLEQAGIHVTYGVVGLKTHSKVILVLRKDFDGLRRYAHIGTGNYHAETAGLYTDYGLFTCDDAIGQDLTEFFNYLTTGYTPKRDYKAIITAPIDLKNALIEKIQREIALFRSRGSGRICFKMNALEDPDITRELYRAGQAGVMVDLIVRDTCRLRPGLPGLSETISVISIVGRFLEHGRVYYFHNGGDEEYYIGSADAMKRNLESRIEVLVPVTDPILRSEMERILALQLHDHRAAWDMKSDGTYVQRLPADPEDGGSQTHLVEIAEKRQKEAGKLKKIKSKGMSRKEFWSAF